MTLERKRELLLMPCLKCKEVMELTGYKKTSAYNLMAVCRENYGGKAGVRTDAILTASLFKALGTTLESEYTQLCALMNAQQNLAK